LCPSLHEDKVHEIGSFGPNRGLSWFFGFASVGRPQRGGGSPSPGRRPGESERHTPTFSGPTGQRFSGRTVGPLGRQTEIDSPNSPGRCPGLSERVGLRPENQSPTSRTRTASRPASVFLHPAPNDPRSTVLRNYSTVAGGRRAANAPFSSDNAGSLRLARAFWRSVGDGWPGAVARAAGSSPPPANMPEWREGGPRAVGAGDVRSPAG